MKNKKQKSQKTIKEKYVILYKYVTPTDVYYLKYV